MGKAIFACALLIAVAIQGTVGDEPEKLVGGTDVDILKYPFMASIRMSGDHICGGAIISETHILTAAHCVEPFVDFPFVKLAMTIVTGSSSTKHGGTVHKVKDLYYHSKYGGDAEESGHDVGIIKLAQPIKFTERQQPIPLPTSDLPKERVNIVIPAWGSTGFPNGDMSTNLQELHVNSMTVEECQKHHNSELSNTEFCTLLRAGFGTCEGDSGSPLIYNGKVVGVVSTGIPCALGIPDVHTNIFRVLDFIKPLLAK